MSIIDEVLESFGKQQRENTKSLRALAEMVTNIRMDMENLNHRMDRADERFREQRQLDLSRDPIE